METNKVRPVQAKDTVMPLEEGMNEGLRIQMVKILKAQAEISFKEGRHIGRNEGVRVGRGEVVEWIYDNRGNGFVSQCGTFWNCFEDEKWQAQKKEWGID